MHLLHVLTWPVMFFDVFSFVFWGFFFSPFLCGGWGLCVACFKTMNDCPKVTDKMSNNNEDVLRKTDKYEYIIGILQL